MFLLFVKSLHIIFIVTWFAGLFYIVRLFIYHTEANDKKEPERSILLAHFQLAERRLWYGITWPSLVLTIILGFTLAFKSYGLDFPVYLWMKIIFVFGLVVYHFYCGLIFNRLRKGIYVLSSFNLRLLNEVATIFLFAIVFIISYKQFISIPWLAASLTVLAILIYIAAYTYRKKRGE